MRLTRAYLYSLCACQIVKAASNDFISCPSYLRAFKPSRAASHTWSQIVTTSPSSSAQPTARNAHAACVVGARMFVTGGSNADGPISDVVVLDLGARVREWHSQDPSCICI